MDNAAKGNTQAVIKLPILQNTLVILGYGAVFLNFIFLIFALYLLFSKRVNKIPGWIIIFNILIFAWQVAFHFNLY